MKVLIYKTLTSLLTLREYQKLELKKQLQQHTKIDR